MKSSYTIGAQIKALLVYRRSARAIYQGNKIDNNRRVFLTRLIAFYVVLLAMVVAHPTYANGTCQRSFEVGDESTLKIAVDAVNCLGTLENEGVTITLTADIDLTTGLDLSTPNGSQYIEILGAGHKVTANSTSVFKSTNGRTYLSDITISGAESGLLSSGTADIQGDRITLTGNDTGVKAVSNVADGSIIWLRDSLIHGNTVGMFAQNGSVLLNNSTVSENTVGANIQLGAKFNIFNSTIAHNEFHGLFFDAQNPLNTPNIGEVYVFSSIIALNGTNDDFGLGEDCHLNSNADQVPVYFIGEPASSFASDSSCEPLAAQSENTDYDDQGLSLVLLTGNDLKSLMGNGCGPAPDCFVRQTHALTISSVARNSGTCVDPYFASARYPATKDQRGYDRGPVCDSGAHESTVCETDPYIRVDLLNTWHMLSVPCNAPAASTMIDLIVYADLDRDATGPDSWSAYRYDTSAGNYVQLSANSPIPQPGTGFWFNTSEALTLRMPEGSVATDNCTATEDENSVCGEVQAKNKSWNLLGNPLESPVAYADMILAHNTLSGCHDGCPLVTFTEIRPDTTTQLWQWNQYQGNYVAFSQDHVPFATEWEGYWARFESPDLDSISNPWKLYHHSHSFEIGEKGPGGGVVFSVSAGGTRGLEAAPEDQSGGVVWCDQFTDIPGIANTEGGSTNETSGAVNTPLIVASCGEDSAAGVAQAYMGEYGQTADWFLPNKEELNLMYQNQTDIGGFVSAVYWSSLVGYYSNFAWSQDFSDGSQTTHFKNDTLSVRAVRAF